MRDLSTILTIWQPVNRRELSHPAALLARYLLGYYVIHVANAGVTVGKIVETEAYLGADDAAAHSYRGMTERTRAMFGPAGHAYIYLSYGMHHCLNVTAGKVGVGEGVLLRALEPVEGMDLMDQRRGLRLNTLSGINAAKRQILLTNGPGKLVQAMGISKEYYGHDLTVPPLYLSAGKVANEEVMVGPRIGISQAVDLPLRYWIKDNVYVSK